MAAADRTPVILLPGAILPAAAAYADLVSALGTDVDPVLLDLAVYAGDAPPAGYGLDHEVAAVLGVADGLGAERVDLVGYSAGGAVALVFAARHPDRVRSLALLEPAWAGDAGQTEAEAAVMRHIDEIAALEPERMMPAFVAAQLRPGVEPPAPPPGPPPPWMAARPAGLVALTAAFRAATLTAADFRGVGAPVYYALGGRSNPDLYGLRAERLAGLLGDFTLEVFPERHHFEPPHRFEAERLAQSLRRLWARAAP